MTIIYHANKVQETSTTSGVGNFVLGGAITGYKTVLDGIGEGKRFSYHIYRQDTNFEWEIGIGYIVFSGGVTQLVRERILSSTNNNNLVGFTAGTKYIESIVGQNSVNTSFINVEEKSSNFTAPYSPVTYIIDASVTGVQVTLPGISAQQDPIIMGFLLDKTISGVYEQSNAITLVPSGSETINGLSSKTVTILKDYLQIISVPSQTGWLLLDPIQDSTNPYGNDGSIQFKYAGAFSGVNNLSWNATNNALLVGGTGNLVTADIILPASGQTVVFNEQSVDKDFRVEGSGTTHMLFVDASTNRIGINDSNPLDILQINSNNSNGITIHKSGVGPKITIGNTSISGLATSDTIGSIVFSGLNSANSSVTYGKIYCLVDDPTSSSEASSLNLEIVNNGSNEDVAVFSSSGITLGFNNQNIDGIIIGNASNNEGNNVCIGYYNSACGNNTVSIGNDLSISSGTFGGCVGYDHAISGSNIWVFGGSGVSVTGSNRVYLAINNNNHLSIINSGSLGYTTFSNSDVVFNINNTAILSSGLKEQISFNFVNSSGSQKSGVMIGMDIISPTNTLEKTRLFANVMNDSSGVRVLSLDNNNVVVGNNLSSGNNIIYGLDNSISTSGNRIFGSNIISTGTNNNIFGNSISYSGNNISIFGNANVCQNSGNLGIVIFGNSNIANEDYSTIIGTNNSSSGLYSVSCGYLNGTHGDYSVSVGEGNLILSNGSIAVGNVNTLSGTSLDASIFAFGVSNTATIAGTGYILGHNNQLYGSGGLIIGNNCIVSGLNNAVVGNNINYSGNNTLLLANSGFVNISGSSGSIIHNALLTAINHSLSVTNTGIYITASSGINISSGNSVKINYGNSDIITLVPGTVHMSGLPVTINYASNILQTSSSGAFVRNNNHYIKTDSSGVEITSPDLVDIHSTGTINISYDSNNKIVMQQSNSYIRNDTLAQIISNSNNIDVAPTGASIVIGSGNFTSIISNGQNNTIVNNYLKSTISGSGMQVFAQDPWLVSTFPIIDVRQNAGNETQILFYTNETNTSAQNQLFGVMQSGRFGILNTNPTYTVDVSGDFRIANTGQGLVYQNYPTATGCGIPLVIENDTIKSSPHNLGCGIVSFTGAGSSGILVDTSERIQLINPNTSVYSLILDTNNMVSGREFFIRNTSAAPTGEQIDVKDGYSSNTLCVLGGTGISGSGNLSCHVAFDAIKWHLISINQ